MTNSNAQPRARLRHALAALDPKAVALFLAIVVVWPVVNVSVIASQSTQLSLLDEYAHADVLRRVEAGGYPRMGERILPETAADIGCRTIRFRAVGTCDEPREPEAIDAKGYNYQAQQPPGYYVPTAALRQITKIGPADDFVLTARLTGAFWLAAGLAALWWLLARLGVQLWPRAAVTALVAGSPLILYQSATVNNDATVLLLGTACVLGATELGAESSIKKVLAACVAAVGIILVKPTALLAIGAMSLAIVIRGVARNAREPRRIARVLAVAAAPALVAVLSVQTWQTVRDSRAVEPFEDVMEFVLGSRTESTAVSIGEASEAATKFLGAYDNTTQGGPTNDRDYTAGIARLGTALLLAGPAVGLLAAVGRRHEIGAAAFVVAVVGGMATVFEYHYTYGIDDGAPGRYGLVLIPFFACSLGLLLTERNRVGTVLVAGVATSLAIADVISLVNL